MNHEQLAADKRERAEQACAWLREETDVLTEVSQHMLVARRAYDSITMGANNSPEVVAEFMDQIASAGTIIDDILYELWTIMEPEETEELRKLLPEATSVGMPGLSE